MPSSDPQARAASLPSVRSLLEKAMAIASARGRTRMAAVNNILEVLESEPDGNDAIALTIAYALRQAGRGVIDREMARRLSSELLSLLSLEVDPLGKKDAARKLIGLVKWIIETADGLQIRDLRGFKSFDDFVRHLAGGPRA